MTPIKRPALRWLKAYTISTFQHSGRRSLLLTGDRGIGKTTLLEALLENRPLPGLRSYAQRDAAPPPVRVLLERRDTQDPPLVIARRRAGILVPCRDALDALGVQWLEELRRTPVRWTAIDEIGFLEQASPAYCRALLALFEKKRVLAVLRKADGPLLNALRGRGDCLVLDLSHLANGCLL